MNEIAIKSLVENQKAYFLSQETKSIDFRIDVLKKLKKWIQKNENLISQALEKDLGKSFQETYLTEISIVIQEINHHLKNLHFWTRTEQVSTPIHLLPSSSFIQKEPIGVCLIFAPWNYPFQLIINPLIGAISAGCCAVVKPSEKTTATNLIIKKLIDEVFNVNHVSIVEGEGIINDYLLAQYFDLIFFTGSPKIGKIIMEKASKKLIPVVLELGGKNPCIVDETANINVAARKIMWGKTICAGQTCVAPDYLLIHESKKEEFIEKAIQSLHVFYGKDIAQCKHYARLINEDSIRRLNQLINEGNVIYGGNSIQSESYFEPTIMDDVSFESELMKEEIFGPILPIFTFKKFQEAIERIRTFEKPLASYYFGKSKNANQFINQIQSGGMCINDVVIQIANKELPFGGIGNSGIGKYHGKYSFDTFTHLKSIVKSPRSIEVKARYSPYKFFNVIKRLVG